MTEQYFGHGVHLQERAEILDTDSAKIEASVTTDGGVAWFSRAEDAQVYAAVVAAMEGQKTGNVPEPFEIPLLSETEKDVLRRAFEAPDGFLNTLGWGEMNRRALNSLWRVHGLLIRSGIDTTSYQLTDKGRDLMMYWQTTQ